MNISVDANFRRPLEEAWIRYQRELRPARRPGEFRIDINNPLVMSGPDARNLCQYPNLPDDFARFLDQSGISYSAY
jgi:hypothetical protein